MEIRKLEVNLPENDRIETGPVQFNDDWPGFFIRGDNAFALRMAIATILVNHNDVLARMQLGAYVQELDTCDLNSDLVKELQKNNG